MDQKINLGEVSVAEYNTIMKQLTAGQLGECIELFMRFRQIGEVFQQHMMSQQQPQNGAVETLPPPAA